MNDLEENSILTDRCWIDVWQCNIFLLLLCFILRLTKEIFECAFKYSNIQKWSKHILLLSGKFSSQPSCVQPCERRNYFSVCSAVNMEIKQKHPFESYIKIMFWCKVQHQTRHWDDIYQPEDQTLCVVWAQTVVRLMKANGRPKREEKLSVWGECV